MYKVLIDKEWSLLIIKLNKFNFKREGFLIFGIVLGVRIGIKIWKVSII